MRIHFEKHFSLNTGGVPPVDLPFQIKAHPFSQVRHGC
jgi:hypothetical protein